MGLLVNFCVTVIFLLSLFQLNSCLYNEEERETIVSTHTSLPSQQSLLPDCNKEKIISQTIHNELLIISTLDGKLTALDVERDGDLKWSQKISSEALLSSTISTFEMTNKGQIVRIVPSLDGNLYLYNGKTIDGIPLNAETLLRSSYKLGDDLVITGGQESKLLAINILTGHVYYECGVKGCPALQLNENETFDDMFLVKRITQTVRAIEPRTGREKWHFSVSEPQLSAIPSAECHKDFDANPFYDERQQNEYNVIDNNIKETDFKVLVPNGIISAKRYLESGDSIQWQYKFESPIVHIWNYRNGHLNQMNLFDKQKLFGFANTELNSNIMGPTIYIGRYLQQWYIQPSNKVKQHISQNKIQNNLLENEKTKSNSNVLQIEWKPQALIYNDKKSLDSENGFELKPNPQFSLSPSTLNDDNLGYYLMDVVEDNETQCLFNESDKSSNIDRDYDNYEDEENGIMQQIVIASLWHYWKEVTAISIVSAFLLNFLYSYLKRKLKSKCKVLNSEENSGDSGCPSISTQDRTPPTPSFSSPFNQFNNGDNNGFVSRYLEDFEPIRILGKGGFGLVFEAKHRIDESHYAVKRICLPCRKEQRDKVMREVRALSKLDHSGIVRYYNAWLEFPPPGWQESVDKQWKSEDISAAPYYDHCLESKQVANKSLTSGYKFSFNLRSRETRTETNYSFSDSKIKSFTETQGSQSLDIVFEENASSIRLFENSYSLLNSNFTNNKSVDSKANDCKTSADLADANSIEQSILLKSSSRPNNFNPPLPRFYLYIQMQLCQKDTLKDWLFANSCKRDHDLILDIFDQIVSAVHYVHSMGLMHRDLKPSNIFFSMDGIIKIGDFGLVTATAVDEESHTPGINNDCFEENDSIFSNDSNNTHTNRVGTQLYMSPEQIKNAPYSHKVDIFSLGIILFELLVPIKTEMERNILLNNARKRKFPNDFCQNFKTECNLLKRLLSHDPEERPSTAEIKEHELLKIFQLTNDSLIRERRRTVSQSSADFL